MDEIQLLYLDLSIAFKLFNFQFDKAYPKEILDGAKIHFHIPFNEEYIKLF